MIDQQSALFFLPSLPIFPLGVTWGDFVDYSEFWVSRSTPVEKCAFRYGSESAILSYVFSGNFSSLQE